MRGIAVQERLKNLKFSERKAKFWIFGHFQNSYPHFILFDLFIIFLTLEPCGDDSIGHIQPIQWLSQVMTLQLLSPSFKQTQLWLLPSLTTNTWYCKHDSPDYYSQTVYIAARSSPRSYSTAPNACSHKFFRSGKIRPAPNAQ